MPKQITADAEFTSTLEVPRPGENVDAADVNGPFSDLLGNDLWARAQISEIRQLLERQAQAANAFTLSLPSSLALEPSRTYTLTDAVGIARLNGYAASIDLQALDVPAGVTVTFNPDPASGNSATMTINTDVQLVPGLYTLTVRGSGTDGKQAEAKMQLNVAAQTQTASFDLQVPAATSIDRATGQTKTTLPIDVTRAGLFAEPIQLAITNLPTGVTASFSVNPVTGNLAQQPRASVLTLTANNSLPTGTYSLNLRATAGNIVRTRAINLSVGAPAVAGGGQDFTADFVYDAGDPAVVNGGTLYINRLGGFTGPITVNASALNMPEMGQNGMKLADSPTILINGQPWVATVNTNTARITAEGSSAGWTGSGIAPIMDLNSPTLAFTSSYKGWGYVGPLYVEATIGGQVVQRYVRVQVRGGTRTY